MKYYLNGEYKSLGMNLSNYYTKKEIDNMGKFEKVTTLPTDNIDIKSIYLVPNDDGTHNEYVYVNGNWELLGGGGTYIIDIENPNFEEIKKHKYLSIIVKAADLTYFNPSYIIFEDDLVALCINILIPNKECIWELIYLSATTFVINSDNTVKLESQRIQLNTKGSSNAFLAQDGLYHEIDTSNLENRIAALEEQLGKIQTNVAVVKMTQADYDALAEKDPETVYIIQG